MKRIFTLLIIMFSSFIFSQENIEFDATTKVIHCENILELRVNENEVLDEFKLRITGASNNINIENIISKYHTLKLEKAGTYYLAISDKEGNRETKRTIYVEEVKPLKFFKFDQEAGNRLLVRLEQENHPSQRNITYSLFKRESGNSVQIGDDQYDNNVFVIKDTGYYYVKISDSFGCEVIITETIYINREPISFTANSSILCEQDNTYNMQLEFSEFFDNPVSITISSDKGYNNTYEFEGNDNKFLIENIPSGYYNIHVKSDFREGNNELQITYAPPLKFSIELTPTSRLNNSGSILVNAQGGFGNYKYKIDGGISRTFNTFYDVPLGNHSIEVIDTATGCIKKTLVTIEEVDIDNTFALEGSIISLNITDDYSVKWYFSQEESFESTELLQNTEKQFEAKEVGFYRALLTKKEPSAKSTLETTSITNQVSSVWTRIIQITKRSLSVDDIAASNIAFSIYPNPTKNFINLDAKLIGAKYKVYTVSSSDKVLSGVLKSNKIDISKLSSGVYILTIEGYKSVKVIKE